MKDVYGAVSVTNIDAWSSDHSLILVEFWKWKTHLSRKDNIWEEDFFFKTNGTTIVNVDT